MCSGNRESGGNPNEAARVSVGLTGRIYMGSVSQPLNVDLWWLSTPVNMDLLSSYRQMKAHVSASKAWLFFAMGDCVLFYSRTGIMIFLFIRSSAGAIKKLWWVIFCSQSPDLFSKETKQWRRINSWLLCQTEAKLINQPSVPQCLEVVDCIALSRHPV